jgi:hypothetical protein
MLLKAIRQPLGNTKTKGIGKLLRNYQSSLDNLWSILRLLESCWEMIPAGLIFLWAGWEIKPSTKRRQSRIVQRQNRGNFHPEALPFLFILSQSLRNSGKF